jgi:hypothetical protein
MSGYVVFVLHVHGVTSLSIDTVTLVPWCTQSKAHPFVTVVTSQKSTESLNAPPPPTHRLNMELDPRG